MSEQIEVPKETKTIIQSSKPESWVKAILFLLSGAAGMFGYQKMPTINEGTKISEAVQVVQNLKPEEMQALQGMQIIAVQKEIKDKNDQVLAAINDLKIEFKTAIKDYDERTTKRLDKHDELILNNIRSISKLEMLLPKARASTF